MFDVKLRENATIHTHDDTTIKRNIYSHYVSNNSPVYCRYKRSVWLIADNYDGTYRLTLKCAWGGY